MIDGASVHLFTGPNTYTLRSELMRWKEQFLVKHGPENYMRIGAVGLTLPSLLDEVAIAPFLSERRLVVLDGIPRWGKEEIEMLFDNVHPASVLLFIEASPDKRLGGVKELLQRAVVKEFPVLSSNALRTWLLDHARSKGLVLSSAQSGVIVELVGENQDLLDHEVAKLALFAKTNRLTDEDIRRIVVPGSEEEVWSIMRLLVSGKRNEAFLFVEQLLRQGEDPFALWNALLWMARAWGGVAIAVQSGLQSVGDITKQAGLPSHTVSVLLPTVRRVPVSSSKRFVQWSAQADVDVKTGVLRATSDSPQELVALLQMFVTRFGQLIA